MITWHCHLCNFTTLDKDVYDNHVDDEYHRSRAIILPLDDSGVTFAEEHPKKGNKHDSDYINKPPVDLVTWEMLQGTAQAHGFGAEKYGRHNFKEGIEHSRLIAAILRHMNKYNDGINNDDESGLSHLSHAAASLNMLMWMVNNKPELDDRWKKKN